MIRRYQVLRADDCHTSTYLSPSLIEWGQGLCIYLLNKSWDQLRCFRRCESDCCPSRFSRRILSTPKHESRAIHQQAGASTMFSLNIWKTSIRCSTARRSPAVPFSVSSHFEINRFPFESKLLPSTGIQSFSFCGGRLLAVLLPFSRDVASTGSPFFQCVRPPCTPSTMGNTTNTA